VTSFDPLIIIGIALAGGAGAVARLVIGGNLQHSSGWKFPIGTAVVNVSGSFALGLVMSTAMVSFAPGWVAIAGTGFLGGFTTFSTASVDSADLVRGRLWGRAFVNAAVVGVLSIAAAGIGYSL
jgi:CrcB protein